MTFYLYSEEIEKQIKAINKDIYLSMNGVNSELMDNHGLHYKKNYGVGLLRLKEIARKYESSTLLAERLWVLDVRETKILATMLYPSIHLNKEVAYHFMYQANTTELIEQLSLNLIRNFADFSNYAIDWMNDNCESVRCSTLLALSRTIDRFSEKQLDELIHVAISFANSANFFEAKAISIFLRFYLKSYMKNREKIMNLIKDFQLSENRNLRYIFEELTLC
jgi:3-methyladenine DNA glycosylase AlkD